MEMENSVPRVGIEPSSVAFWASVPPLHHVGFPDLTTTPTPTRLCSPLPQRSVQTTRTTLIHPAGIVSLLMLTMYYVQPSDISDMHIKDRFRSHTVHSLYRTMAMATSVLGVMKIGNILHRAGIEPTSLAF